MNKRYVIVRTYSAGVHAGFIEGQNGKEVVLSEARRLWMWRGANTLNEIALRGVGPGSRISEAVRMATLTEAIEVLEAEPACRESLAGAGWAE